MTTEAAVIESGGERARARPWPADGHTAYLVPVPAGVPLSVDFVLQCLDVLRARRFTSALTPALSSPEQAPFFAAGFAERERLHLLARDLVELPAPVGRRRLTRHHRAITAAGGPAGAGLRHVAEEGGLGGRPLRRAAPSHVGKVLEIDAAAFPPFWRLDAAGLHEAVSATPKTRFRLVVDDARSVLGYAISGRAGSNGYLQRLAVHPHHQRAGLGRALAVDGLRWMRRRGVLRAVVNTQVGNEPALALYLGLGFRLQPPGLAVLRRDLL